MSESLLNLDEDTILSIRNRYRGIVQVLERTPEQQEFFAEKKKYYEEQEALGNDNPLPYLHYLKRKKYREMLGTCSCDPVRVC